MFKVIHRHTCHARMFAIQDTERALLEFLYAPSVFVIFKRIQCLFDISMLL